MNKAYANKLIKIFETLPRHAAIDCGVSKSILLSSVPAKYRSALIESAPSMSVRCLTAEIQSVKTAKKFDKKSKAVEKKEKSEKKERPDVKVRAKKLKDFSASIELQEGLNEIEVDGFGKILLDKNQEEVTLRFVV
jgi:DNA-binding transcriptional regulator/RsmH inhibitor MraZ